MGALLGSENSFNKSIVLCAEGGGSAICKVKYQIFQQVLNELPRAQGDSGGPLTVEVEGKHTLAGVVSRKLLGGNCDEVSTENFYGNHPLPQPAPGVYTNVAGQMGWIREMIKENGGMASCPFNITSSPTLGNNQIMSALKYLLYCRKSAVNFSNTQFD